MKILKHKDLLKYNNLTKSQKQDLIIVGSSLPLLSIALHKIIQVKESLIVKTAEILQIEKEINFLPKQPTDYGSFKNSADPALVDYFNQTLTQLKENGECSAELLDKYGCASTSELETLLNDLLISGQSGNLEAQLQFEEIMNAYNNDFYIQASNIASEWYTNYFMHQIPNISPGILETLNNLDAVGTVSIALGIGMILGSLIHFNNIHKARKNGTYEQIDNEQKPLLARFKQSKNKLSLKIRINNILDKNIIKNTNNEHINKKIQFKQKRTNIFKLISRKVKFDILNKNHTKNTSKQYSKMYLDDIKLKK